MISIRLFLLISIVLFLMTVSACTDNHESGEVHNQEDHSGHNHDFLGLPHIDPVSLNGRKLKVIASTSIVGDVVSALVGDSTDFTILMPHGQNPHSWSPAPRDIVGLEAADLIFVNGLDLETELMRILESMKGSVVIPVSAGLEILDPDDTGHDHESGDPHTWFSPLNVMQWVENIEYALSSSDPEHHEIYEERATNYLQVLNNLDVELRNLVNRIPEDRRKLVTDHSSISYFARDYGFTILGNIIPAVNDQAEPSARQISELTTLVKDEDIRALFVSNTAGRSLFSLAESVAAESGRDIPVVTILTGSLAEEGNRGSDYPDFMRYNTEQIVENLL